MKYKVFEPALMRNLEHLEDFLKNVSDSFYPSLQKIADLSSYSEKLSRCAYLIAAIHGDKWVGGLAVYINPHSSSFIPFLAVMDGYRGKGIAKKLLSLTRSEVKRLDSDSIRLTVSCNNIAAMSLYESIGFHRIGEPMELHGVKKLMLEWPV